MELVSARWYRDFGRIITALSAVLLVGSLAGAFWPPLAPYTEAAGGSVVTVVLATALILYVLIIHPILLRRDGRFGTSLIIMFLFLLNLINLIHSTGQLHSWYQLAWIAMVGVSGLFGAYMILGMVFMTVLYVVILQTGNYPTFALDLSNSLSLSGVALSALASYGLWKHRYRGEEQSQIDKLSGQLSSNRKQSEVLINAIGDGVVLVDTSLKINLINPAAAKMAGWQLDEANGLNVDSVVQLQQENGEPLPPEQNPFHQILTKQSQLDAVVQIKSRDNATRTASIVITPVLIHDKKDMIGAVAVLRDISESRAEEKRRADFISTASHEMRTPVAAIEGYLALALNDKVSQIDARARNYLEKAHASTQHLGTLFQDLLTSAKAEDGRLVNHPVVVEMAAFTEQLADSLRFAAEKKGLAVGFTIGAEAAEQTGGGKVIRPLYYTKVDPDRIREVVTNLFDNAVKYTESGKVSVGITGNKDVVQLYVRDTGPGIPASDIPHLFQKFYRVDNSTTRTIGGTGLGLFICRKIVELYNGRIWVESEINKGSTFYINLPRLDTQTAIQLQKQEAQSSSLPTLSEPVNQVLGI